MASTSDYIKSMYLDPKEDVDQNYLIRTKKKKRKVKSDFKSVNIVDDDINLNQIKVNEDDDEKFASKEDKPTIENVKDMARLVKSTNSTWKTIETKSTNQCQTSDDDYDLSVLRKNKHSVHQNSRNNYDDSDLDIKRRRKDNDSDVEVERRRRRDDSDVEIERRRRKDDSDVEIGRRRRKDDSDVEIGRRRDNSGTKGEHRRRRDDLVVKNEQRRRRNDSDEEIERKRRRDDSVNEQNSDFRRHKSRFDNEIDNRPREGKANNAKNSNLRDKKQERSRTEDKLWRSSSDSSRSRSVSREKPVKVLKSNLHKMKEEREKKSKRNLKREDDSPVVKKINEISDTSSDEDIREKLKKLYDNENTKMGSNENEELKAKYKKWNKGMKQVEDLEKRREEEEYEMSKPLARYKDDDDLDKHLKDQELVDDPMLDYFRKRKEEKAQQEQYERTGEIWVIPKYESKIPPPINRFNIWPGYRWDGIDRGNGFEARLLAKRNEKQANEEEEFKYGSLDM